MIDPQLFELGAGTAEDRLATIERWIAAQNPLLDHLADRAVKLEAASGNNAVVLYLRSQAGGGRVGNGLTYPLNRHGGQPTHSQYELLSSSYRPRGASAGK